MLDALAAWPVAAALRGSAVLYPLVSAAHILAIGVLIGAVVTLDLRLLGAFGRHDLAQLGPPLRRMAATGLGLAAVTGFLLFSTRPIAYTENPAFWVKLGLIGLGLANVLALRSGWRQALAGGAMPRAVRAGAAVSLVIWIGAVLAGRWIGFLQ